MKKTDNLKNNYSSDPSDESDRKFNTINTRNSVTSFKTFDTSFIKKTVTNNQNNNFMFIPCINCNNLINIEELEKHSEDCTNVKDDVILAESSSKPNKNYDFKLNKLLEHIKNLKSHESIQELTPAAYAEFQKDLGSITLLNQYILDTINCTVIDHKSISEMKKILTNIDVSSFLFNY